MRKRISIFVILALFMTMVPGAFAQQKSYAGKTLRAATWGGSWQEIRHKLVGQQIEKATGAKVEWVLGNPVDHLAKLIAAKGGDPPFDIAEMGSIETVQARELGFIDKIDRSLAPNMNKAYPEMVASDAVAVVGTEYVIAYIPSKFKELGIAPPTRLEDLFQPKLSGKFALPFVGGSTMGPRFLLTLAMDRGGSINNIKPALDRLKDVKVSYYYRATSELEMRMLAGEVYASYWSISRPYLHKSAGKDMDYASVGPKPKRATNTLSNLIIVKGSKNRELAHMYVDYALGLNAQYGMVEWGGVRPVTEEGTKKVLSSSNPNIRRIAEIPWKDVFTIDFPPSVEIAAKNIDKWLDQFNREVGSK